LCPIISLPLLKEQQQQQQQLGERNLLFSPNKFQVFMFSFGQE
jgi:hypothetical protein